MAIKEGIKASGICEEESQSELTTTALIGERTGGGQKNPSGQQVVMPTINDCMTLERSGGSKYSEHRSGASNEWKEGDVQEPSRVNGKHAGEKPVDGGNVKSPGIHENMERSKPRHNGAVASNGRIHDDEIASGRQEEVTSGFSDGKWAERLTNGRHREMPGEFEELVMPEAGHENGHQQLDFKEIIKEVLEEYEDSPDSILQFKNTLLKRLERLVPRKKPQSRFFKMDSSEFRKRGKEMVDYIADYMETLSVRRVTSQVEPGYLKELIPSKAPWKGDDWDKIMEDVERVIMPGITHWQHPHFHAYFPAGNSYPSILGDMLSDAIGCVGFSWAASPACTELETIVLDWVGKMIGLPKQFLHEEDIGGGVIQSSASECVLITMLAARHAAITDLKRSFPFVEDGKLLSKLVGYSSKLAHSCVEKAGMIGLVKMRELEVDSNYSLRGYVLEAAIEEDRRLGLIPFYVSATLGTTAVCSFDNLAELAEVCSNEKVWLHVDGAYAGSALICPEYQHLLKGIEYANSINLNPNKWMLVNFDCSLLWVKDSDALTRALTVDPVYLQHPHGDRSIDFRHWGIPLSRRFRALKLWFVIRTYGVDGLQQYIREHVRLSKLFEAQVLTDDRFETIGEVTMGLVCFRLKGPNTLTQKLLRLINDDGRLHVVPALVNEHYVIRFAICAQNAEDDDITYAWSVITEHAEDLFSATRRNSSRESIKLDSDTTTEDEEEVFLDFDKEIIYDNQRSNFQRARMRRNLFLRMVSDPKSYNPRLWKSLCLDNRDRSLGESPAEEKESASSYPASVAHSNGGLMH